MFFFHWYLSKAQTLNACTLNAMINLYSLILVCLDDDSAAWPDSDWVESLWLHEVQTGVEAHTVRGSGTVSGKAGEYQTMYPLWY